MICNSCRANVDNDLVFCTECGARLHEGVSEVLTESIPQSVVTQVRPAAQPKSHFKWIALGVAVLAFPLATGLAYLILQGLSQPSAANKRPAAAPVNDSSKTNQNSKAAPTPTVSVTNSNSNTSPDSNTKVLAANSNSSAPSSDGEIILDDRFPVDAKNYTAFPFTVGVTSDITGEAEGIDKKTFEGFVYTEEAFETKFPDTLHKAFSFGGAEKADVKQLILPGKYVLVFVNKDSSGITVRATFRLRPNPQE